MECAERVYRQRNPKASPLYRLFDEHFEELKRVWSDRFEEAFGPWQRHWDAAVAAFLSCGDPECGFARVYCDTCRKEFLLPFSCKRRGLCPSCSARRRVEWADHVIERVLPDVPYRMLVFTIPRCLRGIFMREHAVLGDICRVAYQASARFLAEHFPGVEGVPYFVSAIHTAGSNVNPHPHVHCLCSLGIRDREGTFHRAAEDLDWSPLEDLFRHAVLGMLLRKRRITEETARKLLSWTHSGFSVDGSAAAAEGDRETLHRLASYLLKPPVSLGRLTYESGAANVLYQGKRGHPDAPETLVCDPLRFLALVLLQVPGRWEVRIRYYGAASSTARRHMTQPPVVEDAATTSTFVKARRRTWAKLIARVYGADPLRCTRCGGRMRILSVITDPEVVEKILRHLHLWHEPRAPPSPKAPGGRRVVYDEALPPDAFFPDSFPSDDFSDRAWSSEA
jgi:hypothetical protein